MLPHTNRMRRREEFTSAVRGGQRAGRPLLAVHLKDGRSEQPAHVGFAVSRAVGNAVVRNRVRRRLRHLMRDRLGVLPSGSSVVVRANRAAAEAGYADLGSDLDRALERALRKRAGSRG